MATVVAYGYANTREISERSRSSNLAPAHCDRIGLYGVAGLPKRARLRSTARRWPPHQGAPIRVGVDKRSDSCGCGSTALLRQPAVLQPRPPGTRGRLDQWARHVHPRAARGVGQAGARSARHPAWRGEVDRRGRAFNQGRRSGRGINQFAGTAVCRVQTDNQGRA